MAGKSMLGVGRRPQFLSIWPSIGLLKCFHNMQLASSKASRPRMSEAEVALSFVTKPQNEIMYLLPLYLIGNTDSHSLVWKRATERCKNQEVKIIGDHLESWHYIYFLPYAYFYLYHDRSRQKFILGLWFWSFYLLCNHHTTDPKWKKQLISNPGEHYKHQRNYQYSHLMVSSRHRHLSHSSWKRSRSICLETTVTAKTRWPTSGIWFPLNMFHTYLGEGAHSLKYGIFRNVSVS